jgi:Bacterial cadherin-like domain
MCAATALYRFVAPSSARSRKVPAPDAVNDNYSITEDQLLVVPANGLLVNDTDPDGDPLAITRINGLPFSYGTPIALAQAHS